MGHNKKKSPNLITIMQILLRTASWVARGVTNLPAIAGGTRDESLTLSWEYPLKKKMATQSSILAWRIPRTYRGAWWATVYGAAENQIQLSIA